MIDWLPYERPYVQSVSGGVYSKHPIPSHLMKPLNGLLGFECAQPNLILMRLHSVPQRLDSPEPGQRGHRASDSVSV